jgi:glycosyltransferase involved in cell wall biosynthesis
MVSHGFPPSETGGVELYTAALARALCRAGHDVHVLASAYLSPEPVHERSDWHGIEVERFHIPRREIRLHYHEPRVEQVIRDALERVRPDAVHVQHPMFLSTPLVPLARAAGAATVVTLHDHWFMCPEIQPFSARAHPLHGRLWGLSCFAHLELADPRRLAAMVVRRRPRATLRAHVRRPAVMRSELITADRIVFPSRFLQARHEIFGLDEARAVVLAHGIDPVAPGVRERAGDELVVGYLGAMLPGKGADLLVRAFRDVDAPHARLVLRGPAPKRRLFEQVRRLAAPDPRITLGPAVPRDVLGGFFAGIDLLVVPSRLHESFSLVTREAFSAGVPVAASDAGALGEIVEPGRNGALFPAGDRRALRDVLAELLAPGRLDALRAFPPVKTMDDHAAELVGLYADCGALSGSAPARGRTADRGRRTAA